jgi:hypothetical protein
MTNKKIIGVVGALGAAAASIGVARLPGSPFPAQENTARCGVVVPKEWGEYIGAGSYGLEFKDEAGTIRFVKQFPCGLDGAPSVSLEVHRK